MLAARSAGCPHIVLPMPANIDRGGQQILLEQANERSRDTSTQPPHCGSISVPRSAWAPLVRG